MGGRAVHPVTSSKGDEPYANRNSRSTASSACHRRQRHSTGKLNRAMRQSRQQSSAACRRPGRALRARSRVPVYATFALLAVGFSGIFEPSRAGLPMLNQPDNVQPGDAGASGAPRAEIPMLNQRESPQPGEAGISGVPQAGTLTINQKDSARPPDAGRQSAAHPSRLAHRPHKATHARPQLPLRTGNLTTQLNQQEMVRHQASSQRQQDPVSAWFGNLFR